jgi:hypothetical protein
MTNSYGPSIVRDGLVLYLDAGDRNSYPGTGNTWYDLSGGGNNGAFGPSTAAPSFSSDNKGSIVFGGNDYVDLGSSLITGNNSFSWGCWIKPSSFAGTPVFFGTNSNGQAMVSYWDHLNNKVRVGVWGSDKLTSGTTIVSSTIGYTFWTWNGTTLTAYTNGSADGTATGFSFNISSSYTRVGSAISSQYFNGSIFQVSIYNRALSANEVQRNYNATRGRFGI